MIKGSLEKNKECHLMIGGSNLTLKPLPLKKFREVVTVLVSVIDSLGKSASMNPADFVRELPEIILSNFEKLVPVVIDQKTNPHVTSDWVQENVTVPEMEEIIMCVYKINGIDDFLDRLRSGFGGTGPGLVNGASNLAGSSTSLESATAGGSAK